MGVRLTNQVHQVMNQVQHERRLNQSCLSISGVNDAEEFDRTVQALFFIGMDSNRVTQVQTAQKSNTKLQIPTCSEINQFSQ